MSQSESGEVSRRIHATPSTLYELVSDVTRIDLWAAECERCCWLDGVTSAGVGARFQCDNRFKDRTWSTVSVVDEAVPQQRFAFHTDHNGEPITRWVFTFAWDGESTTVTERFERVALPDSEERDFENGLFGGRLQHNLGNMALSLQRLAEITETP